ncbi:MAG: tRNA (5-methylaminomethyl-2-thiouridine)(34)-methyltransferase MnmD [Bacteroidales bacterium]
MTDRIIKPIITEDGSHTLYIPGMDEHYHSFHGAIQESTHVFIETGFKALAKDTVHVLEIGFGTGLNALLTALEADKSDKMVYYTTLELYPLSEEITNHLNYPSVLGLDSAKTDMYHRILGAEWLKEEGEFVEITPRFFIRKLHVDFTDYRFNANYNLIYFDAFAPDKQPEMWTSTLFDSVSNATEEGGILTTYCAKGVVRRALIASGFKVERLPGPPGKREMLRGTKLLND